MLPQAMQKISSDLIRALLCHSIGKNDSKHHNALQPNELVYM